MTKPALRRALISWFKANRRDLPWRHQPHWYKTFLSEILLQQTQVSQALPYYRAFMETYPTVEHLAQAKEEQVLQLWAGLGYYSRARNLLKAAQQISQIYGGSFPPDFKTALQLPGIGPYTAAAILSIAFNQPYAVLDGNVFRVLARLQRLTADIRLPASRKVFQQAADQLLDRAQPGLFNEALMELGATICTPTTPDCGACPLRSACKALKHKQIDALPVKSPPPSKKQWYHLVFILVHNRCVYIRRRPASGLLARMWEFPAREVTEEELIKPDLPVHLQKLNLDAAAPAYILAPRVHVYSHIRLSYRAVEVELTSTGNLPEIPGEAEWVAFDELPAKGLHGAHKKLLEDKDLLRLTNN